MELDKNQKQGAVAKAAPVDPVDAEEAEELDNEPEPMELPDDDEIEVEEEPEYEEEKMTKREIQQVIKVIQQPAPTFTPSVKKVGREPNMPKGIKKKRFVSDCRELTIYRDSNYFIQFHGGLYETNNEEDIKLIKRSRAFGEHIWENTFPRHVARKMEEDSKTLVRNEELFNIPEA